MFCLSLVGGEVGFWGGWEGGSMNLSKFLGVPSLRKFGEFLRRVSSFFILFISVFGVGAGGKLAEVIFSICAASEILLTTLLSRLVSTDWRAGYW